MAVSRPGRLASKLTGGLPSGRIPDPSNRTKNDAGGWLKTEYDEQFGEPGFKIFILMKNHKICFEGNNASDGEPYYGSGFWVDATMPADREREAEEAKRREEVRHSRNGGTLWW